MTLARTTLAEAPWALAPALAGLPPYRRPAAAGLARDAHLSLVTTPAGLAALESGWRELERQDAAPHCVFQSFDWVSNWARAYAGPGSHNAIAVIAGQRQGRLAFVWPLMRMRHGPVTVLRWLSEPLGQYGDILIARGEDAFRWLDWSLALIRREAAADTIWLRHVRSDAAIAPWLAQRFHSANLPERAPYLDLTAFASEADYEARYTPSQRKRRKKIRKGLEEAFGPVEFKVLEPAAAAAAIRDAVAEKNKWIEERGRQNQVLGCPRLVGFLERLARLEPGGSRLLVTCMTAGGRPMSWELGLRFGGTHFGFITSHVTALTDYSPARLHMDYSQRLALRDGMAAFDLMVPHDVHKESWSSAMVATGDYYQPVSVRGWLFGRLYLAALRPALRAAYYRLPERLLRALKPVLGH